VLAVLLSLIIPNTLSDLICSHVRARARAREIVVGQPYRYSGFNDLLRSRGRSLKRRLNYT